MQNLIDQGEQRAGGEGGGGGLLSSEPWRAGLAGGEFLDLDPKWFHQVGDVGWVWARVQGLGEGLEMRV